MKAEADQKELFETAPVSKAVLSLAIPTVISQLITFISLREKQRTRFHK